MSAHFTLAEMAFSDTATRLGIDNSIPAWLMKVADSTMSNMEQVRAILNVPVQINSAYRCEALERVLCQKDFVAWCLRHKKDPAKDWPLYYVNKDHPKLLAVDFKAPAFGTPEQIVAKLVKSPLMFKQLICEGTWVHIAFGGTKREVMTATFSNGTPTYTMG